MSGQILISIIMPVYNESNYIAQAIESVIYQKTEFYFEIIVIDDGSTDSTVGIVESYQALSDNIILLKNTSNRGKGFSFKRGYEAARGKYFHVLDGDDYFSSWEKLQKQVDFLENNSEYVAVCHNTLILNKNGSFSFAVEQFKSMSLSYQDCINNKFYAHTSSFMYRKIHDFLPEYFDSPELRGDSAVFFYHVYHSKKRIKYFPDLMSVYNYTGRGLWSGETDEGRRQLIERYFHAVKDHIVANKELFEYSSIEKILERVETEGVGSAAPPCEVTLEEILNWCVASTASVYADPLGTHAFQAMHYTPAIDQLCANVGQAILFSKKFEIRSRVFNAQTAVIIVSGLKPSGGGIFRELQDIVKLLRQDGKDVYIFSTNIVETQASVFKEYFSYQGVNIWIGDSKAPYDQQVSALIDALANLAPGRIYPFPTHHDCVMISALQRGLGEKIILDFVYDHGLSLGISNSSIDIIVAKAKSQAKAIVDAIGVREILLIPPFMEQKFQNLVYAPRSNILLTTASASARNYKLETPYIYPYDEIVVGIIDRCGTRHYHYGPLSADLVEKIRKRLDSLKLSRDRFVHVLWAENLSGALLAAGVDIFIAPFPITSARIIVEMHSAGIPVLGHESKNAKLPQSSDFSDPDQLTWHEPEHLYRILNTISANDLQINSSSALTFFKNNNAYNVGSRLLIDEQEICSHDMGGGSERNLIMMDLSETGLFSLDWNELLKWPTLSECEIAVSDIGEIEDAAVSLGETPPADMMQACDSVADTKATAPAEIAGGSDPVAATEVPSTTETVEIGDIAADADAPLLAEIAVADDVVELQATEAAGGDFLSVENPEGPKCVSDNSTMTDISAPPSRPSAKVLLILLRLKRSLRVRTRFRRAFTAFLQ